MKKRGNIIKVKKTQDTILNSLGPLPREYYNQVPLPIRENYRQVVLKMRSIPPRKSTATFEFTVKLWKPVVIELREYFERQRWARGLPHNMKFTDYFLQFQRAADNDFIKKPKLKKAKLKKAGPKKAKLKKAKPKKAKPKKAKLKKK